MSMTKAEKFTDKYDPSILIKFWLGHQEPESPEYFQQQQPRWFSSDKGFDLEVRNKFIDWFQALESGLLEFWKEKPEGKLAYLLLCDQIPRNSFRGTDRAFQYDKRAETTALDLCESGEDLKHSLIERIFIYLPLEHSEKEKLQLKSVEKFEQLLKDAPIKLKDSFQQTFDYAKKHYEIIHHFHRFPHRNKVLKRTSTEEEIKFIEKPENKF